MSEVTEKLLALSFIKGVGAKTIFSLEKDSSFKERDLMDVVKYNLAGKCKIEDSEVEACVDRAKEQLEISESLGHQIISFMDDDYPKSLVGVSDAPPILFVAGSPSYLSDKSLSVIGTREPSKHGERIAEKVTTWFSKRGWIIVSGLAKGVDTVAHKSAIKANGKTVAVMAHGLDKIYPSENRELAEDIVSNGHGAIVSEYPYKVGAFKSNFVKRDRIQAALSAGVVLVQTGVKGGSLHASRATLAYGRPLILVGQSKHDLESGFDKSVGVTRMMVGGKEVICDILSLRDFDESLVINLPSSLEYENVEDKIIELAWWKRNQLEVKHGDFFG